MSNETVKHTPGPWRAKCHDKYHEWEVLQADELRHHICTDIRGLAGADEANARLIASAPDLLEACKDMQLLCAQLLVRLDEKALAYPQMRNLGAAIAKAEGR